jgi:hypothetical protein
MSILQRDIASDDRAALERAVAVLEHPNWITRLSGLAGKPVELIGNLTPKVVSGLVARASQKALMVALRLAMTTLTTKPLWRSELLHKVAAAGSGAVGGTFGLATLPIELPISTTLILRSIAEIARHEGEDLSNPKRLWPAFRSSHWAAARRTRTLPRAATLPCGLRWRSRWPRRRGSSPSTALLGRVHRS